MLSLIMATATLLAQASPSPAPAASPTEKPERWSIHAQVTNTLQSHPGFPAAYTGPQSLFPARDIEKSFDFTSFFGGRLWKGAEFYIDHEFDQGFGLGNPNPSGPYNGLLGAAGFYSNEATKVGATHPYGRLTRYFIRQTFDFGGDRQTLQPDQNQLGETTTAENLILTFGKFSVVDVFDTNPYAHDSKNDFLNWSIVDMGSFDYAADAWGYSRGLSAELTRGDSTLRAGIFQLSLVPNSTQLEKSGFRQFSPIVEFERRTSFLGGHPGTFKALAFGDYGYFGTYDDAVAAAAGTGAPPDLSLVRTSKHWKLGGGLNIAQEITPHVGLFTRLSAMNGVYEEDDWAVIDRSISGGVSLGGDLWRRPNDAIGVALARNAISTSAQRYFAAGGLENTMGDGGLSYANERIFEAYYRLGITKGMAMTGDYQRVVNPGYNAVRGPVSVFGLRYHAQL
ncbi:MAG: carbohydrate porin [Candidatus Eremiobacteraeota bacterium]|nr:carbohydrate porin [Candidatus Eremiobacteraeota bacterium]MBV8354015.1 carbohydrate porin [Candidatus Eremiobacteraeota bacterium]